MRRVSVVGAVGSGKSTVSRELAARLGVRRVELDALFWGPDWTPRPHEQLLADARREIAGDAWVIDGNYTTALQPEIWARADAVVWLDPPKQVVIAQVYGRTLARAVDRTELWPSTGNRQRWRDVLAPWRKDGIVRRSWDQVGRYPELYCTAMADPTHAHLDFHHLRSRGAVETFLAAAS
ncbi:toxin [Isoptericola sp. NPDC057559]|uniref:toxin n=1 Tax=Isoptericola sp. NPDC057559 TaxID=3346168 RepID=UPI0036A0D369